MRVFAFRALWILLILLTGSCVNKELPISVQCTHSDLLIKLVSKQDASNCKAIDGELVVTATGGAGPYDYQLGGGIFQTNPVFVHLQAGTYTLTTKDTKGCTSSMDVVIAAANSTLNATLTTSPNNQCHAPQNGSVSASATGGTPPYLFKIDNGTFGTASSFSALPHGVYTVIVKDGTDCEVILHATVQRGDTGISYAAQIQPILNAACNFSGCHGAGTGSRDWTNFSTVKSKATQIKMRTGNRSMPIGTGPSLSQTQIEQIACWVDDGANNN
ncbi:MAG: SprB repeat-containing protein [Cytophagales bacterium]|nr:SprB repeat-containing protein [Cytophagales bacterium]